MDRIRTPEKEGKEVVTFKDYLTELTDPEIKSLENYLDRIFAVLKIDVDFTRHFKDRLRGREAGVEQEEIRASFNKLLKKYKDDILKKKKVGVLLKDMSNDINVPFVINQLRDGTFEMDTLTIMKKRGFKATSDTKRIFKVS